MKNLHRALHLWIISTVIVVVVEGAFPQCQTMYETCMYQHVDATFTQILRRRDAEDLTESERTTLCNSTLWSRRDQCYSECPLHLQITQPAEFQMRICMVGNNFLPFAPDNHIDATHPIHGVELEIVRPGKLNDKKSIKGCKSSDYTDKSYDNKIVFLEHGDCYEANKFVEAAKAKAAAAIDYNWRYMRSQESNLNFISRKLEGRGTGFENLPALGMALHQGGPLLEALNNGTKLFGKIELTCAYPELDTTIPNRCPSASLRGICDSPDLEPKDRLCNACGAVLQIPVSNGTEEYCLFDNDLQPIRERNMLQYVHQMPLSIPLALYNPDKKKIGCKTSDYVGLEGKYVAIQTLIGCVHPQAVLAAQRAGVAGYIYIGEGRTSTDYVTGGSELITIPVHSLDGTAFNTFKDAFSQNPDEVKEVFDSKKNLIGKVMDFTVVQGEATELAPWSIRERSRTAAAPAMVDADPSFEWSLTIVISLALIVLLSSFSIGKIIYQRMTGVNSVVKNHTDSSDSKNFSIPLNAASMGLSLTLLLVIALTAFLLTHEAGKSSTDTARDDGDRAVEETFTNAVDNINDLNNRWLRTILESAAATIDTYFDDGERYLSLVAAVCIKYDGSYSWIADNFETLSATLRDIPWNINIKTIEGYYMDSKRITNPLLPNNLSTGADPRDNYISSYEYNVNERSMLFSLDHTREEFNPDTSIGEGFGDPFGMTQGSREGTEFWIEKTYSFPQVNSEDVSSRSYSGSRSRHPFSVLRAIYDINGGYKGVVEGMRSASDLSDNIIDAVRRYPGVDNITTFLIDKSTGVIISSSFSTSREVDQFLGTSYVSARESFSILNTYQTELNALGAFIKHNNNGSLESAAPGRDNEEGEFDESEYYNHDASGWEQAVFRFTATINDDSPNNYKSEMKEGGCHNNDCLIPSNRPGGGSCLRFDGQSIFYIYFNLTTDTPRVAGTRVPTADGSWQSSFPLFNKSQRLSADTEAIMYKNPVPGGSLSPVLREPLTRQQITLSVWINPDGAISTDFPTTSSPRIFSDTKAGNAAIRWYANGRLYLGIVNFGCITDPVKDIPPGQWTHLIATIDRDIDGTCTVYVNGELHSRKEISPTAERENHDEPYQVGEYFNGMMDDFMILNISISSPEAKNLFETGKYTRVVPSKKWSFTSRTVSHSSLSYLMGVMLPTDDILSQVIANNDLTRANLNIQKQNTDKKLDRKTYDTAFVLVALALVSVLIFITFNDMLTRPFAIFAVQLSDAAVMKCDTIDEDTTYLIKEMNSLHRAMILMITNLREYKAYMPASVIALQDTSEEEETDMSDTISLTRSRNSRNSSRGTTGTASGMTRSSVKNIEFADARVGTQVSLTSKRVSIAVVNVTGFHSIPDTHQLQTHQEYLTGVLTEANNLKGVPDTFVGDKILLSFNAVRPCAGHRSAALRFVTGILPVLESIDGVSTTCGAGSGHMRCGNIGIDRMKHYTFISPIVSWVYALERFAKGLGQRNLVDNHLKNEAAYKYSLKMVGWVKFAKLSVDKRQKLTTVLNLRRGEENTEWMYQLENAARQDTWHFWNQAAENLYTGESCDVSVIPDEDQRSEFSITFKAQLNDCTTCTEIDLEKIM
eukprot:TRINITY_DN19292_c0_g1_i1.p1 TRINITY_DN19292_c0_g1~~TRINITY_DN19292_c0_g1_i1.p1  ORF type:complete len:1622 (+),score=353.26 TRINITY_DN19292_c0_g1_i1:38-4867(+)